MRCAACVGHVERAVRRVTEEEDEVTVSLLTNSVCIVTKHDRDEKLLKEQLRSSLSSSGYTLLEEKEKKNPNGRKKEWIQWGVSAFFTLLLSYLFMGKMIGLPLPSFLLGEEHAMAVAILGCLICVPVIVLNFHFFKNGISALIHRAPNMDSLISLGAGASVLYGCAVIFLMLFSKDQNLIKEISHDLYFESAAMILTLISFGKLLEGRAKERASAAIETLAQMTPKYASVLRNGEEVSLLAEEIGIGEIVIVRAGEMIPVDGIVTEGTGCADESAMTGESIPVDKQKGSDVCSASLLLDGFLKIEASKVGKDTSLAHMIRLIEDAASSRAPIARIADRVSAVFVPAVMGISLLTFILWMVFTQNIGASLKSAVSVLVISCPCALGLATPTAITVGIGRAARKGILFKSAEALENLCSCKTVVFDKTGTLTRGKPVMTDVYGYGESPLRVVAYAAAVERMSSHPLALAIVGGAEKMEIREVEGAKDFESVVGVGAKARLEIGLCSVGKPNKEMLALSEGEEDGEEGEIEGIHTVFKHGINSLKKDLEGLEKEGKTVVCVTVDERWIGIIGLEDDLREESRSAVEALKSADIACLMLTGDHERTAASVAEKVSLDGYYASLLPEDKERIVRELSKDGACAMVGDGINDAPALLGATVGIAVGAGTEIAIDCADVIISDSSPMGVSDAYFLSRASMRVIKQNLFWALFYNAACIPIAAGVLYPWYEVQLSPMIAALAMSCSSVCVVMNALRLRHVRLPSSKKKISRTYTLSIDGMMCMRCVEHVKRALESVDGVERADVDLSLNKAVIKASSSVSVKKLIGVVVKAGYWAKDVTE